MIPRQVWACPSPGAAFEASTSFHETCRVSLGAKGRPLKAYKPCTKRLHLNHATLEDFQDVPHEVQRINSGACLYLGFRVTCACLQCGAIP